MKHLNLQFWTLLVVCIISGVLIAMMDISPNWDDTGITGRLCRVPGEKIV
jgi:hypothetical protein